MALSDLHSDHRENAAWLADLSQWDYRADTLILAGDVSDDLKVLQGAIESLAYRFRHVLFVPGNHELWVWRDTVHRDSLDKFETIREVTHQCGASMEGLRIGRLRIEPVLGWYDHSFGVPGDYLLKAWVDFRACRWPTPWSAADVTDWFMARNQAQPRQTGETLISFSHFVPRLDLLPERVPPEVRALWPVMGSARIDQEVRRLGASIHVYGHSHLNRLRDIDGIRYINNAFGYPREAHIAARRLVCIHEI